MLIADKIEPYLQQVKEQADKIPEKAHELAGKIQPAAEKLGDQIEQGASKVLSHAHAHAQLRWSFKLLSIALLTGSGQNILLVTWNLYGHGSATAILCMRRRVPCMQDNFFRGHLCDA